MYSGLNRRWCIWIVEDSPTDAARVRRALEPDHDVEVMHDGAAALERLAASKPPDLLVLDWVMPGISGLEVCRYLRSSNSDLVQLPILLLTAQRGTDEIVQAFQSGANDYVSKPFVDEELRVRVAALLESKRLLERAEQAEANVRSLLSNAPDAIFAIDAQGNVTYANDEALRILGAVPSHVQGVPITQLVSGLSQRNISVGPGESLLPLPDVTVGDRIFSPSIRLLPSDSAAVTTISLRDVTARRIADARRLDFYSIIAHDLRAPLHAVLMRMELALVGKHGLLPAGLLNDLRKMHGNLRALVAMINDFLELARMEGLGHKIDRKPVELCALIRTTMDDFAPLLESRRLVWDRDGFDEPVWVMGDRRRLVQVLTNLIGNAIKFTERGGHIRTEVSTGADALEVAIVDTGRGIPQEALPTVFERYRRAPESSGDVSGSGLGLMIVREIIEAHGGKVGVESEADVGSRFWFRLPRAPEPTTGS